MLKIWGRNDGSNVIKVMWCVGELGVGHERIDWGGPFGGNDAPDYRRKNPNGRIPTLEEEDGFTLWESGAVLRYLCASYSPNDLWPEDARERAACDKWMDWSSLNMAPFNTAYLDYYFRTAKEHRDPAVLARIVTETAPWMDILDNHLATNDYIGGNRLTMADFPAGSLIHRWLHWTPQRPPHPNIEAYYGRLAQRPAYREHVIEPNRKRTEEVQALVGI